MVLRIKAINGVIHFIPKDKIVRWLTTEEYVKIGDTNTRDKVTYIFTTDSNRSIETDLSSEEVEALYEGRFIDGKPMELLRK